MIITGKKFSKPTMSRVKNGDIVLPENSQPKERIRLDMLLVERHPEYNRSTLQNFIKSGYVTVADKIIKKPNYEIVKDEIPKIILSVPEREIPEDIKKFLIYENDDVIVLNKPSGLLSMAKGEFTTEPTLEDYGLLVHRLDRDTSGVVILAKNEATQSFLRKQFQERKAHKTYYAIVDGRPKLDQAIINLPIARNLKYPTTFMVDPKGKPAETFYKIVKTDGKHSLIELKPISGRTHQLRVHLRYIGCPIVGDKVYNDKSKAGRLMLHASSLEITIPSEKGNVRKTFVAELPTEFKEFF